MREHEYSDDVDMESEALYSADSVILVGERADRNSCPFLSLRFECVKPVNSCTSYYRLEE